VSDECSYPEWTVYVDAVEAVTPAFCSVIRALSLPMEGPIKFEDPGPKSIGGRARSLSPDSKSSDGAATNKETLQAPVDTEDSSQLIASYSAPQSMHYGISNISPESAAAAVTAAAAGYSYSLPPYASLEQHEPRIGEVDRKRESPRSPEPKNTTPSIYEDAVDETPFPTNAKQFHRILKRRVDRQRLEEALRIASKGRKPDPHESRHNHKRKPLGPGARFLTADEVAETEGTKVENKKRK
jgi:hypothetical protein